MNGAGPARIAVRTVLPYDPWPMGLDRRTEVKVPQIIALFWVVKVLTTAMGESISDYSVHRFDPVVAVAFGFVAFAVAILVQLAVRRYLAWVYWLAVAMVAVFGTMAADVTHVRFGVPYAVSTAAFAVVLAVVFVAWQRVEHTLSIHSVDTPAPRAVLLGDRRSRRSRSAPRSGDLMATTLHLGYFGAGVLFAGLICVPAIAWRWFGLNAVAAFWTAYVLTRPLGASFADWLGKPAAVGGAGARRRRRRRHARWPIIVVLVAYLAVTRLDVRRPTAPAPSVPRAQRSDGVLTRGVSPEGEARGGHGAPLNRVQTR